MSAVGALFATVDRPAIAMTQGRASPDFLLALAFCHWPPCAERVAAIRNAARYISDWNRLPSIVRRHKLIGLATHGVRSAGIALPSNVVDEMAARTGRYSSHRRTLVAETVHLQNLFAARAIPVIVLKGVALEQLAYTGLAAKQTSDIDLLVLPEHADEAWRIIERQGYALSLPAKQLNGLQRQALISYGREVEFVHPQTRMRLELQWRAADNPLLLKGITAHSPTQSVALSETVTLRTLSSDDLFAYLCVHGAHHSWALLKWLADLNAFIVSTAADVEHLYRHAQKIGAGLCAGQGLLLCQRLLGLKLPTALADELQTNKRHQKLVALAMRAMTAPSTGSDRDPGIRGVLRELRNRFLLGQGLRFYLAECRLALVGSADIVRLPLPRPLHFVYPLVRLPMWLWRRLKVAWAPARLRAG
jgi:Uncharacterised nucleotidyltransferase